MTIKVRIPVIAPVKYEVELVSIERDEWLGRRPDFINEAVALAHLLHNAIPNSFTEDVLRSLAFRSKDSRDLMTRLAREASYQEAEPQ